MSAALPVLGSGADPAWRPKLVVLDLDGTVVPYGKEYQRPSERVIAAIAATVAAGVPVTVATGRAIWNALPTVEALGLQGVKLVCSNGATVYDADSHTVLHSVPMDPAPGATGLLAARPEASFAVEDGTTGFVVTPNFPEDFESTFRRADDLQELIQTPTTRLICRIGDSGGGRDGAGPEADHARSGPAGPSGGARPKFPKNNQGPTAPEAPARTAMKLADQVLDPALYRWEIGYSGWIDVTAPGVSKASGVSMLAQDLGVDPSDVLAVGDGSNDVEMFRFVGHAVSMGQARQQVHDAAHEATETIDADGVAVLLERWFADR